MANNSSSIGSDLDANLKACFNELYQRTVQAMTGVGKVTASVHPALLILQETAAYVAEVMATQTRDHTETVARLERSSLEDKAKLLEIHRKTEVSAAKPATNPTANLEVIVPWPNIPLSSSQTHKLSSVTSGSISGSTHSTSGTLSLSVDKLRMTAPVRPVVAATERRNQDFLVDGFARTTTEEAIVEKLKARGIKSINYVRLRGQGPYRAYVSARISVSVGDVATFTRPDFWGLSGESRITVTPWVWREETSTPTTTVKKQEAKKEEVKPINGKKV